MDFGSQQTNRSDFSNLKPYSLKIRENLNELRVTCVQGKLSNT